MRSGVNLKRPVLLGGSKFLLRIFIQETLRFPNPSANILNTQKGVVNTTPFFYFFCPFKLNNSKPPIITAPPIKVPIPGTSLNRIKLINADNSGDRNIKFATSLVFSA